MKSALSFHDVSVRYRQEDPFVLHGISLDIAPGERVALLGLNGSGKTTLLYSAVGLVPYAGEISVGDVILSKTTERSIRDHVGFLFGIPDAVARSNAARRIGRGARLKTATAIARRAIRGA
jgi:ABC-type bacteriocin/lantibiotic exporter with double-glycine peptidase domain